MFYKRMIRPLLFWYSKDDPEKAHDLAMKALRWLNGRPLLCSVLSQCTAVYDPRLSQEFFGLRFPNPLGLAAGFDKNGEVAVAMAALGFGFVEIGTATRHLQKGYKRPRIFRFPDDEALINWMGFPNVGAVRVRQALERAPIPLVPLGASIGKSTIVPLESAWKDYLFCLRELYHQADYFVVDVSSPNTPGLRRLQERQFLDELLHALGLELKHLAVQEGRSATKPLLVKISPDLSPEALAEVVEVCAEWASGIIATNTIVGREGLRTQTDRDGGLSGKPLFRKTPDIVCFIRSQCGWKKLLIGVGGISSARDAYLMIRAGANLVQVYTALVYQGPLLVHRINTGLLQLMQQEGIERISQLNPKVSNSVEEEHGTE